MQTILASPFERNKFAHMLRVLSHPADAFYEIRHRGMGSVWLALLCIIVFAVCYTANRILGGFIVNDVDPMSVDGLAELFGVVLLMLLFSVGNWSVTCLLSGEGRFRDIVTVGGYSLIPLIACYVIATIVSRFIASGEESFYTILLAFGVAWTAALLLLGVMTVHNYTLVKTLATLVLTVLSMFIMIFFALLLADMINQMFGFFYGIYVELLFRS